MTEIPEQQEMTPEQAYALLQEWYKHVQELAPLKVREVLMRKDLRAFYFPAPQEGTNRLFIGGGCDLMLKHQIIRKVDEAALDASVKDLRKAKIKVDELFVYKPQLVKKEYEALTPEQREMVDAVLTISEGEAPQLSIVQATQKSLAANAPPPAEETPAAEEEPPRTRRSRAKPKPEPEPEPEQPAPARTRRSRAKPK